MASTTGFKNFIRAGSHTFPGGYPVFMIAEDGGCLCYNCAKENAKLIIESTRDESASDWYYIASDINWEYRDLICDNCNGRIESAYCED